MNLHGKTLLVRADATEGIGGGHIMRCLALAARWQAYGGRAVFACAALSDIWKHRLLEEGMEMELLAPHRDAREERLQVIRFAQERAVDALVVDLYRPSLDFLDEMQTDDWKVLCLDDNAELPAYPVDFLLNQNAHATAEAYAGSGAQLLLGPRFALLRSEFSKYRDWKRAVEPSPRRLLLSLGGGNQIPVMTELLSCLADVLQGFQVSLVLSRKFENTAVLEEQVSRLGLEANLLISPPNMAEELASHDLLISSGGSSVWEALYQQIPALFVAIAENQVNSCRALRKIVSHPIFLSPQEVKPEYFADLAGSLDRRQALAAEGRQVVDGHGAERVIEALCAELA